MLILNQGEVQRAVQALDPLEILRAAFFDHSRGQSILPEEAALRWRNSGKYESRSLTLPAALPEQASYGAKIINSSLGNRERGFPRASGVGLLFDPETAEVTTLMPAGWLSATRTAAVTALFCSYLMPGKTQVYVQIGLGELGLAHARLLLKRFPTIDRLVMYDRDTRRAAVAADDVRAIHPDVQIDVAPTLQSAVVQSNLLVTATTVNAPIIDHSWLQHRDVLAVNVSLDDLAPETYLSCQSLYVDDWELVSADETRLLGRMAHAGSVVSVGEPIPQGARAITGDLGGLVAASFCQPAQPLTVVNPFGCGVADVALYKAVDRYARTHGMGQEVALV